MSVVCLTAVSKIAGNWPGPALAVRIILSATIRPRHFLPRMRVDSFVPKPVAFFEMTRMPPLKMIPRPS
jgi:hypothetical protein